MKAKVKLPKAAKELVDGVTSFIHLAGQAVESGGRAVRQVKKAAGKTARVAAAAGHVVRAGRDAASSLRTGAEEGDAEIDLESGTVVIDLRGKPADGGTEGNER